MERKEKTNMNGQLMHTETAGAVTYRLYIEAEDIPVRGNAMASGDDALDKKVEDEILERLDSGDIWAWAHVTVEASAGEFTGEDTLGGCCYRDAAEFMQPGGYYEDMKSEAFNALKATLERACASLAEVTK
jgi:hypothetical protein